MKSQLEQFNLLDEAIADDAQVQDQGGHARFVLTPSCRSVNFIGGVAEQPDANDALGYLGQGGEDDENPASEGLGRATTEQPTDGAGSDAYTVDHFDGGESSDEAEPEQARPAGDEESDTGQLLGDEHTEQLAGVVENDPEHRTAAATADGGHPSPAVDLGATNVHEYSDLHDLPLLGDKTTESEEAVVANEFYEADYHQNEQDSEPGGTPTIEGGTRGGDLETTASDAQQVQDDLHDDGDVLGTEKGEQAAGIDTTDNLTSLSVDSDTTELTAPRPDDDPTATQQGTQLLPTIVRVRSNPSSDTDTDSIGQQTLDEFTDAQEEPRDDYRPREEANDPDSNTGEWLFSASFSLMLTRPLDQSNEQIPDLEQYGDGFNWDEDFGGDFDDGEFDGFEDQSNVEENRVGSQEPSSGRNSKRGFDEVESDTADEEGVLGDVSPSKSLSTSMRSPTLTRVPLRFKTKEGVVVCTRVGRIRSSTRVTPAPIPSFSFSLVPSDNRPRSSVSLCSHHKHLLSSRVHRGESAPGMKSLLLTFLDSDPWDEGLGFWAPVRLGNVMSTP